MANITTDMIKELRERTGVGMMDCKRALGETDGDMDKAIRLLKERGAITAAKKGSRTAKEGIIGLYINEDKTLVSCIELQCETDFVAKNEGFQSLANIIAKAGVSCSNVSVDALLETKTESGESVLELINASVQKMGEKTVLGRFERIETTGFLGCYLHFTKKLLSVIDFDSKIKTDKAIELAGQIAMHVASEKPLAINREALDKAVVSEQREIFEKITLESGKTGDMLKKIVDGKMNAWYSESVLIDQKLFSDNKISIESIVADISKETGCDVSMKGMCVISIG